MSGQSAFEKRYVDPKDQSKVEGLLELFNLPPQVITFLKRNKRAIQVVLAVILVAVISGSLYTSYRERKIESAASALALALQEPAGSRTESLQRVSDEYASTPSGVWARVELAHIAMNDKKFPEAAEKYAAINSGLKKENPLFALTLYGLAEAREAQGDTEGAYGAYEQLKSIAGYELTGYTGMARIHEQKGELEKALGIYGQYLAILGDAPEKAGQKAMVEARIARIKARQ